MDDVCCSVKSNVNVCMNYLMCLNVSISYPSLNVMYTVSHRLANLFYFFLIDLYFHTLKYILFQKWFTDCMYMHILVFVLCVVSTC